MRTPADFKWVNLPTALCWPIVQHIYSRELRSAFTQCVSPFIVARSIPTELARNASIFGIAVCEDFWVKKGGGVRSGNNPWRILSGVNRFVAALIAGLGYLHAAKEPVEGGCSRNGTLEKTT